MTHGTRATYLKKKCRCPDCTLANSLYMTMYFQQWKKTDAGLAWRKRVNSRGKRHAG